MRVFFEYRTDFGEEWLVFREENAPEFPGETVGLTGDESVTRQVSYPADLVAITLIPGAILSDKYSKKIRDKDCFRLMITDLSGELELITEEGFSWEDAVSLGRLFRGLDPRKAKKIWKAKRIRTLNSRWLRVD